jgi:hypothetical protein
MAQRLSKPKMLEVGRWMTLISGISFVLIGGLVVFLTTPFLQIILAGLMVLAGLHLLRRGQNSRLFRIIPGGEGEKKPPARKVQINVEERVA